MWFAKWFGAREDDSEPSEHPPHPLATAPKSRPNAERPQSKVHQPQPHKVGKGFDPYNSGEFDKNKAWERVNR